MNYTPAQTRWFLRAIADQEREAHRADVVAARVAQASEKGFRDYLGKLK